MELRQRAQPALSTGQVVSHSCPPPGQPLSFQDESTRRQQTCEDPDLLHDSSERRPTNPTTNPNNILAIAQNADQEKQGSPWPNLKCTAHRILAHVSKALLPVQTSMTTPELSSKGERAAVSPDLTDPAQGSKKHVAGLGATPTDVRMMDKTAFVAAEDADTSPLTGQCSAPQANKRTHFRNTNAAPPKDAMTTLEVQKGLDHTKWTGESVHPEIADIYTKHII